MSPEGSRQKERFRRNPTTSIPSPKEQRHRDVTEEEHYCSFRQKRVPHSQSPKTMCLCCLGWPSAPDPLALLSSAGIIDAHCHFSLPLSLPSFFHPSFCPPPPHFFFATVSCSPVWPWVHQVSKDDSELLVLTPPLPNYMCTPHNWYLK